MYIPVAANSFVNTIQMDIKNISSMAETVFEDSFTAPMAMIHAVLTAMSIKRPKTALTAFQNLEQLWDRQKIYFSPAND